MLQTNGRAWYDIIKSSRTKYKTPKPMSYRSKRHYYQSHASASSSEIDDQNDDEDDNHSTMTSSSSSCTTNSSNNSIASPIPTSTTAAINTNTTTPSPSSANSTMIARKRRGNLPKTVTAVLKQWLIDHCRNPYPTEAEKTDLKDKTGLTLNQISNWFINARRRLLPQILDTMHPDHKGANGVMHQQHHISEDDDDEDDDPHEEDEEDNMIPMPQQQKRKRKSYLYSTNSQQGKILVHTAAGE
ncbi:homeobox KN domain-containing protein [Parasitella parasitica]|nr:homeobox KN domain-containing protein [Parasitella parasitica]